MRAGEYACGVDERMLGCEGAGGLAVYSWFHHHTCNGVGISICHRGGGTHMLHMHSYSAPAGTRREASAEERGHILL